MFGSVDVAVAVQPGAVLEDDVQTEELGPVLEDVQTEAVLEDVQTEAVLEHMQIEVAFEHVEIGRAHV